MRSKPWRASDDTQSVMAAMKVEGRREMVPGKARWCWAMPMLKVGAMIRRSSPFSAAWAMISGQSQSVPSRPVGPCCSFEPIGTMTVLDRAAPSFRRASISGQDDRWISMGELREGGRKTSALYADPAKGPNAARGLAPRSERRRG